MPKLQPVGEVCTFLRWQRKFRIPSSAAFGKIGDEYIEAVYRLAEAHYIPLVHFKKGRNKETVGWATLAQEGTAEGSPPAHGLGTGDGLYHFYFSLSECPFANLGR